MDDLKLVGYIDLDIDIFDYYDGWMDGWISTVDRWMHRWIDTVDRRMEWVLYMDE